VLQPLLHQPLFWALALPAVVLVGLAKGGFAGVGTLATPLLALAVPPVQAAAILLPILIVQDAVSVWVFRKSWNKGVLAVTLPGAVAGIALGYALAAYVPAAAVELAIGAISIAFGLHRLLRAQGQGGQQAHSPVLGVASGVVSGFTSQISHAGAPPFQMYVLPLRLPQFEFIGTSAIYFAAVNWLKVPAYVALGQFDRPGLGASLALMPVALASTWAGVWLVRRVPAERFFRVICVLLVAVGARLAWEGATQLLR
jgi:uncharacterized membrane protein YfcA